MSIGPNGRRPITCGRGCAINERSEDPLFASQHSFNLALNTPKPVQPRFGEKVKALIRLNRSAQHHNSNQDQLHPPSNTHQLMVHHQQLPTSPPTKQNMKAWWNQFTFSHRNKKDTATEYAYHQRALCWELFRFVPGLNGLFKARDTADHPVFGKPLNESLRYASVQISTANASGDLYVWGYIPVVVAKW